MAARNEYPLIYRVGDTIPTILKQVLSENGILYEFIQVGFHL
jgi:hypothetical protein